MNMFRVGAIFLSTTIAIGCGGGGSSTPSNPGNPSNPIPVQVAPKLTVQTSKINQCNLRTPQTDSVLIVHNDDFTNRSVHSADEEGRFSIELPSERMTVSILSKEKSSGEQEATRIDTFYQVSATDLGVINNRYYPENDPDCECVESDISLQNTFESNFPERSTLLGSSVRGGDDITGGVIVRQKEICRTSDGSWPVLGGTMRFGGPSFKRVYTGKLTEYEPSTDVVVEVNAQESYVPVHLIGEDESQFNIASRGISGSDTLYYDFAFDTDSGAVVFSDEVLDYSHISLYDFDFSGDYISLPNHTLFTRSVRSVAFPQNQTLDFEFIERQQFARAVEETIEQDSYDFSEATGAEVFILFTDILDSSNGLLLRWRIVAPIAGSLSGIDNFSIEDTNFSIDNTNVPNSAEVEWLIADNENLANFDEYIAFLAEITSTEIREPSDTKYISIEVDIDDPNLFPVGQSGKALPGKSLSNVLSKSRK